MPAVARRGRGFLVASLLVGAMLQRFVRSVGMNGERAGERGGSTRCLFAPHRQPSRWLMGRQGIEP